MNDQNPYDQSLRDKLSRLPVPDVQKNWPQMRMLLDEEMPEGGRSKRRGGWWFFSAILIFIIAGSWTLLTFNFSKQNVDPPLVTVENTSAPGGEGSKTAANTDINSEKPGVADDKTLLSKKLTNNEDGSITKQQAELPIPIATVTNNQREVAGDPTKKTEKPGNAAADLRDAAADLRNAADDLPSSAVNVPGRSNSKNIGGITAKGDAPASGVNRKIGVQTSGSNRMVDRVNSLSPSSNERRSDAYGAGVKPNSNKVAAQPAVTGSSLDNNEAINDALIIPLKAAAVAPPVTSMPASSYAETIDSIKDDYGSYVTYAPVSRKFYRQNKKYVKPVNIRQPYTTAGRNFAIGLSLPLAFPLGDQKPLGYNVNAGPNTVSDYIPAPHAQYHFNAKAYIQSELQVMSPQFIKPALLYQTNSSNSLYQTTSSVSAQKLYYFNVPVSLHYSPFKHFYMGTGLQFSSLLSGVAMHEQLRTGMVPSDSIYQVSYTKFSNDSISGKLNGSEMRLMLDANYYWNKFTVGLRYNQALSNYVSTRATPTAPITVDKNKSLQFYMRFNLWEDKKKAVVRALVVK